MTDVGKIKLGVEIDADGLSAKLGAAVRKAIAPALARVQAELQKTQREYDKTGQAAVRSSAVQVAALKAVEKQARATAEAIGDIHGSYGIVDSGARRAAKGMDTTTGAAGRQSKSFDGLANSTESVRKAQDNLNEAVNIFGKRSPEAIAMQKKLAQAQGVHTGELIRAAAQSRASTDSQVNDYQRLAREAEISAARQAAAQRAASAAGGGGGGGSGRGRGGMMGFLTGPVGINLAALGIGSIPAASAAIMELVGSVQTLAQAGIALPGVFGGVIASVGTAALGFHGLSDAIGDYADALKSGDPKDMLKALEAMKDMDPAAQAVVKTVATLVRGPLLDLQKMVQARMFAGFDADLQGLADTALPRVSTGMGKVADTWNATLKTFTKTLGSDSTLSFVDRIFGNTAEGQKRANAAIEPFVHAFGTLSAAGSDVLPRLGDALTKVTQRFDAFITAADGDGRLAKWIDQGLTGMTNFGNALLNLGKIITGLTSASGTDDGGFLKWLADATDRWQAFVNSDEGQAKIGEFFKEGREQLAEWAPILKNLVSLLGDVYEAAKNWSGILLPFLQTATDLLASMPGGVEGVVTAFLAWRTISGVTSLLGKLGGLGGALDALPLRAGAAAGGISGALSKIVLPAGLAALLFSQTGGLQQPDDSAASKLGGLGLNVAGGAAAGGMRAGPWGAALGAMIGAGVTLFQSTKQRLDEAQKEWDDAWQKNHDDPAHQAMQNAQDAKVLAPLLNQPAASSDLAAQIAAGQMKGFSFGPDGQIIGPNGQPFNLPGLQVPPSATPKLPAGLEYQPPAPTIGDRFDAGLDASLDKTKAALTEIKDQVAQGFTGSIKITDPTPEILENLRKMGVQITEMPDGSFTINPVGLDESLTNATKLSEELTGINGRTFVATVKVGVDAPTGGTVQATIPIPGFGTPHRADGGVFPGYAPGVDSLLAHVSPGEGVLIPEAVRGLGGGAGVYAINSRFRSGLSRAGYADGGVVPGGGLLTDDNSVTGLLTQIRDLLAGKGAGPLATTAANTDQMATAATKAAGETTGPFGTPIKARNPGYEMAAAAIQALGGDPEKFLGADPTKYAGTSASGALSATTAMPVNYGSYAAGLQAFAASGSVSDVTGLGLDANDPVVKAIAAARNKKKGLGDDQISELIGQVFGGGFTGTLDSSNTSLVSALQTYREKLAKAPKGTAAAAATALPAAMGGSADALDAFAQSASGGSYQWGASDLSKGLSDCSGAVSDLVEMITKGQADSGRLFSTANAGQVLSSLGAVQGAVPGALQIGWSDSHMRATLPNGVNFESGGATGQGATYGGNAQGAAGMPNIMSLSAGQLMGGAGALGAAGGGTGTPVYVTNWPGQGGNGAAAGIFGAGIDAVKGPLAGVAGNVIDGITHGLGPAAIGPGADLATLLKEGNPLAVAAAAGFNVPDFTRAGGEGGKAMKNAADFTPQGQLLSDTGSLTDRTASSIALQIDDMKKQLVAVVDQVSDKLGEDALKPVLESAIQSGLEGLKDSVGQSLGSGMGTTAGPIIADATARAVSTAIPAGGGGGGGGGAGGVVSAVTGSFQGITKMAAGGGITGGTIGVDSVPIMAQHGEFVLDTGDVNRMGGFAGVEKFRRGLASGTVKGYATGGGVISNSYAGAEFFGVSQVPIIGAIVNALISVLLSILGIQLEERDTLQEMTGEFRQFRGDFKAYNEATGQLLSDTAAVSERTQSSTDLATQERVRILKLVISELIKFIFNQIVIPITKAVANSAIQAGASAAGMAINSQAPGAGSIVSSLISSGGQAGVDIGTQVWGAAVDAITPVATDMVGDLLQAVFPNIMDGLFSGQWLNALFQPLGDLLGNGLGGLLGGLLGLFGVAGGAATDNGMFDDGGMAYGMGYLPKATVEPERVLSPRQTSNHERLTDLLDSGALDRLGGTRIVHVGGITVLGSQNSADEISSKLTSLLT